MKQCVCILKQPVNGFASARNREFIEQALEQALTKIEETHDQSLIIDRDTKGQQLLI